MKLSEQITRIRLDCRGRHALSAACVPGRMNGALPHGREENAADLSIGS
jgi:hypothetical protein